MANQDNSIRETIEEAGKILENFGFTPMQGRIIACFTVSDPPEKTFDELVKYFNASKSSVSNSLNYLLQNKIIDYKTIASDRRRYFYLTDSFFLVYFSKVLANVGELKEYAYRIVSMRNPEFPEASENILKWIEDANRFQESIHSVFNSINGDRG